MLAALPLSAAGQTEQQEKPAAGIAAVQAERGEKIFRTECAACHTTSQFATPEFTRSWSDRAVFELFDQIRVNMPQDNPGKLSPKEYLDVVIYLLKLNGADTGGSELPPDEAALKGARIKLKGPGSL